jgi:hypothetical protein
VGAKGDPLLSSELRHKTSKFPKKILKGYYKNGAKLIRKYRQKNNHKIERGASLTSRIILWKDQTAI